MKEKDPRGEVHFTDTELQYGAPFFIGKVRKMRGEFI
jgi:hypothetical protein